MEEALTTLVTIYVEIDVWSLSTYGLTGLTPIEPLEELKPGISLWPESKVTTHPPPASLGVPGTRRGQEGLPTLQSLLTEPLLT